MPTRQEIENPRENSPEKPASIAERMKEALQIGINPEKTAEEERLAGVERVTAAGGNEADVAEARKAGDELLVGTSDACNDFERETEQGHNPIDEQEESLEPTGGETRNAGFYGKLLEGIAQGKDDLRLWLNQKIITLLNEPVAEFQKNLSIARERTAGLEKKYAEFDARLRDAESLTGRKLDEKLGAAAEKEKLDISTALGNGRLEVASLEKRLNALNEKLENAREQIETIVLRSVEKIDARLLPREKLLEELASKRSSLDSKMEALERKRGELMERLEAPGAEAPLETENRLIREALSDLDRTLKEWRGEQGKLDKKIKEVAVEVAPWREAKKGYALALERISSPNGIIPPASEAPPIAPPVIHEYAGEQAAAGIRENIEERLGTPRVYAEKWNARFGNSLYIDEAEFEKITGKNLDDLISLRKFKKGVVAYNKKIEKKRRIAKYTLEWFLRNTGDFFNEPRVNSNQPNDYSI